MSSEHLSYAESMRQDKGNVGAVSPEVILKSRFITRDDDAQGYIAMSLYIMETMNNNYNYNVGDICQKVNLLSDESISIIYRSASSRILDSFSKDILDREIDNRTIDNRIISNISRIIKENYDASSALIEGKSEDLLKKINKYAATQAFLRQVASNAVGTILTIFLSLIIAFGPDLLSVLRKAFSLGG